MTAQTVPPAQTAPLWIGRPAASATVFLGLAPVAPVILAASTETLQEFLNRPGGAIWRIFWLHLQHPEQFPIYDQHVHRAMAFMLKWPEEKREIPVHNPTKVRNYLEVYRPFFARFNESEESAMCCSSSRTKPGM